MFDERRPFTRAEALAAGISPKSLRGPRFRRIFRNVYVDAAVPATVLKRVEGALTLFDAEAFASHRSAARVYGVPIPANPSEHVSVTGPSLRRRTAGIECHLCLLPSVRTLHGLRVSDPCQLFVELADLLSLVDLVVVGDALVGAGWTSPSELRAHAQASSARGAVAARTGAAYVRDRVDSPMETRLRLLIVLAGLPEPEVNLVLRDVDGQPVRRYDLCWPSVCVIVEYDGRHHVEREAQWEVDLERREAIDDEGWRILVVTSRGIYRDPERTLARIHRVLARRGLPGVPQRLDEGWRPHFGR